MAYLTGCQLGTQLCEALGLDARVVKRIEIVCDAGDMASIMITEHKFVDGVTADKLRHVLACYEFRQRPDKPEE